MYDIVIVGAGPAGSNLARLIGEKYRVLLIDKRDLENEESAKNPNKCCGGLLSPDAQKMIAKLGLGMPKDILVDPQLFAVKTIDLNNDIERLYQKFYYNMDRGKFDRWLVSLIPDGVERRFKARFKSFTEISGGYELKYIFNKEEINVRTRAIVAADGASSSLRKSIGKDIAIPEKYIAIQEWFEYKEPMAHFAAIFDEEVTDFYSWIIPKGDHILLGSALKSKDKSREKYDLLKMKLRDRGFNFGEKIKAESAYIYRPKKLSQFYLGKDNIALIGEAAGAISPSSAEGFSYAFKNSLYLAESLEEGIDGFVARYKDRAKGMKLNLLLKNLKSPAMYNPYLRRLAMKSGLLAIK